MLRQGCEVFWEESTTSFRSTLQQFVAFFKLEARWQCSPMQFSEALALQNCSSWLASSALWERWLKQCVSLGHTHSKRKSLMRRYWHAWPVQYALHVCVAYVVQTNQTNICQATYLYLMVIWWNLKLWDALIHMTRVCTLYMLYHADINLRCMFYTCQWCRLGHVILWSLRPIHIYLMCGIFNLSGG